MRKIQQIVLHCSATPNGRDVPIEEIDRWHQRRGFERAEGWRKSQNYQLRAIGYHYVIRINGLIQSGRHHGEIGAHAAGHNQRSIGICMNGLDKFTQLQWEALKTLVGTLTHQYPKAVVVGHRDLSPDKDGDGVVERGEWLKTCPGFQVADWMAGDRQPLEGHVYVKEAVDA